MRNMLLVLLTTTDDIHGRLVFLRAYFTLIPFGF